MNNNIPAGCTKKNGRVYNQKGQEIEIRGGGWYVITKPKPEITPTSKQSRYTTPNEIEKTLQEEKNKNITQHAEIKKESENPIEHTTQKQSNSEPTTTNPKWQKKIKNDTTQQEQIKPETLKREAQNNFN
ncbi:MAG: hypothetical protein LBP59_10885 [Planctomycetaceae bacterium]|jgi:hypothetical protein|nr:hypothetical protein [Planctomycetaceae bacterium]